MSTPSSRLRNVLGHLLPLSNADAPPHHFSHLSPTFFLERAAAIEPNAEAVYHVTANGKVLRRSYMELADRARGLAYYLRKKGLKRVGLLAPNTPAFLESIYGIVAAGGVIVPANIRLKPEDISYIFDFAEVDAIIVDKEYENLLDLFRASHPQVEIIIDLVCVYPSFPPLHPLCPPNTPLLILINSSPIRIQTQPPEPFPAPLMTQSSKAFNMTEPQATKAGRTSNPKRYQTRTTCSPSHSPLAPPPNQKA